MPRPSTPRVSPSSRNSSPSPQPTSSTLAPGATTGPAEQPHRLPAPAAAFQPLGAGPPHPGPRQQVDARAARPACRLRHGEIALETHQHHQPLDEPFDELLGPRAIIPVLPDG